MLQSRHMPANNPPRLWEGDSSAAHWLLRSEEHFCARSRQVFWLMHPHPRRLPGILYQWHSWRDSAITAAALCGSFTRLPFSVLSRRRGHTCALAILLL